MKFKNFLAIVSYFRLYGANTATLCWGTSAVMAEMLPNKEAISEMFYHLHCFFCWRGQITGIIIRGNGQLKLSISHQVFALTSVCVLFMYHYRAAFLLWQPVYPPVCKQVGKQTRFCPPFFFSYFRFMGRQACPQP